MKRTWAEIDLDCIESNFKEVRKSLGNTKIMCVVKADAYGHGTQFVALELEKLGADWFAVSNIEEGIQLRRYGVNRPILVLGYTPVNMAEKLCNFNISQAILSYEYAAELNEFCIRKGVKIKGHVKLDTGMSRIGFACQSADEINQSVKYIEKLAEFKGIDLEGIFTHFAMADCVENGREFTKFQFNNFMCVVSALEQKGIRIPMKHCCNSGAIIDYPEMKLDMVRAGIILYGLSPSEKLKGRLKLEPAMKLMSVISQIKKIKKGTTVSYGRTFMAQNDMMVATVPIGYADGYSRGLSDKAYMLVCGQKARVIGRVCMDQLILDVTGIDGIRAGDEVCVFGRQGDKEIHVDELSKLIGTINYEIICLIGKRVPRIYFKDGKNIGECSYM